MVAQSDSVRLCAPGLRQWLPAKSVEDKTPVASLKGHAGKKATDRNKLDTRFFYLSVA